jgi:hypothetical protein
MLEPKGIKNKNISDQPDIENALEPQSEEVRAFWTPVKIKALIGLIIAMSIVLALGFGFFIFKLVTSVLTQPSEQKGQVTNVIPQDESYRKTNSKDLSIYSEINLNGFKIEHIAATEKELILHVSKKAEGDKRELAEIWIFNKDTKKISGKIKVTK